MAAISQIMFSDTFSWMEILYIDKDLTTFAP